MVIYLFSKLEKGNLNDLWKWNGTYWTWMSGRSVINQPGNYGTLGVPSLSNIPGGRYSSVGWTALDGSFWLFGGTGFDSSGSQSNNSYLFIL